jgi:hypothetical protein
MTYFVVEHEYRGCPVIETLAGIEDIDTAMFPEFKTIWVCDSLEEVSAVEDELRRKHARSR